MPSDKDVSGLIRNAYDAATDPRQWPVFLENFARAVQSSAVALIAQDLRNPNGNVSAALGFDPSWERLYDEYFGRINVWIERAPHLFKPGIIPRSDQVTPDSELIKTEFYNDFLRPQGHFYSFGGVLLQEGSMVSYIAPMRSKAAGPFGETDIALLRELMPHLQCALRTHDRLAALQNRVDGLTDALNHLAQGVILADGNGRPTFVNRYAEDILRAGAGLRTVNGMLQATRLDETEKLRRLIAEAAGTAGAKLSGQMMTVSRSGIGRDLSLMVAPLTSGGPGLRNRPAAIVFIADPDRAPDPKSRELEHLLQLTGAESRLAKALADGKSVAQYADDTGVSVNTARSHLKQIFAKTGVSRQSDLVRLILSVLPPRSAARP